jgi:type VI secretion system secreted protein VgrG
VIGFLEGDPDRPMVIGRVHNGTNMPPLYLPQDKHKTIIRDQGDNRIVMHGKAGQERMTMLSPKNINFVAMRPPAKPLSAQTIDNVTFPDFEDGHSLKELFNVYQALVTQSASSTPQPDGNKPGTVYTSPGVLPDIAASVDINTLSENDIDSLSGGSTNGWVNQNLNTWVNGDVHTQVNGNATAVIGGTDFGGTSTTSTNTTEVWGDNVTEAHRDNITTALRNNVTNVPSGDNNTYVTGTNYTSVSGTNSTVVMGSNYSQVFENNLSFTGGLNTAITIGANTQLTWGLSVTVAFPLSLAQSAIAISQTMVQLQSVDVNVKTVPATDVETLGAGIEACGIKVFV